MLGLYAKPARRASDGPCWGEPGTILRAYDYANRDEAAAAAATASASPVMWAATANAGMLCTN